MALIGIQYLTMDIFKTQQKTSIIWLVIYVIVYDTTVLETSDNNEKMIGIVDYNETNPINFYKYYIKT